jgi:MFS family permease
MLAPVQNAILAGILLIGIGVSFTLFTANANALVQLAAPDYLRGRLISIYLLAFVGVAPVGGLFAGWLAEVGGTSLAFAVAGATSLATILVAHAWRSRAAEPALSHAR